MAFGTFPPSWLLILVSSARLGFFPGRSIGLVLLLHSSVSQLHLSWKQDFEVDCWLLSVLLGLADKKQKVPLEDGGCFVAGVDWKWVENP